MTVGTVAVGIALPLNCHSMKPRNVKCFRCLLKLVIIGAFSLCIAGSTLALVNILEPRSTQHQSCGHWQQAYTAKHARILAGIDERRIVVAAGISGLADTLTGAVTVFYFALLTGRAFLWHIQADGKRNPKMLEAAYIKPNIDWSVYNDSYAVRAHGTEQDTLYLKFDSTDSTPAIRHLRNMFRHGNLSHVGSNFSVIHVQAASGLVYDLFHNSYYSTYLHSLGLRPETAFGCALNYLVDINPSRLARYQTILTKLASPQIFTVGIQVRVGDHIFTQQERGINFTAFSSYFTCASKLSSLAPHGKEVVWFLVSDSYEVRKAAALQYGERLVADVSAQLGHFSNPTLRTGSRTDTVVHAMVENWLFAYCHVFVVPRMSGFGRTAALRSLRWNSVYYHDDACTSGAHASLVELAHSWSGF